MSNSELIARLLYALRSADNTISTAINIEDQKQVIVLKTDGSITRITTKGDGLVFLSEVLDGLVKEEKRGHKS